MTASVTGKAINPLIKVINKKTPRSCFIFGKLAIIRLTPCWFSSCVSMLSVLVSSNLHHGWLHVYFCVFLYIINAHRSPDNTACTCDLENICMWILPSNWTTSRERDMGGRSSPPAASMYMQSTRLKEHLYYCLLKAAETLSYIIQRHHY